MSQSTVLATVFACLEDDVYGLRANIETVAPGVAEKYDVPVDAIRTEFRFVKLRLPGPMAGATQPTTIPNVMARPVSWTVGAASGRLRDGTIEFQIGVEYFDADENTLNANRDACADALALMVFGDGSTNLGLREYSDATSGPVIEVLEPMMVRTGDFDGPVSSGILATIQIEERSRL